MANRFIQQAQRQVSPIFQRQSQAIQSQRPAINKLFDTIVQGLESQRDTESQNILESASRRGVLRSTMPVDLQTQLGQDLLRERGQIEAQRAGQLGDIETQVAQLGRERLGAITSLADTLQQQSLREREFKLQQQAAARARAAEQQSSSAIQALLDQLNQRIGSDATSIDDILDAIQEWQERQRNQRLRVAPTRPQGLRVQGSTRNIQGSNRRIQGNNRRVQGSSPSLQRSPASLLRGNFSGNLRVR